MATTNKPFAEGALLPNAVAPLYTTPASTVAIVKKCTVCNTTAGALTFTLYKVPSAGAPAAANMLTNAKAIAAGATYEAYEIENHVLAAGDSIQAFASAAAGLSFSASGLEIV